jgi:hypothetical protein
MWTCRRQMRAVEVGLDVVGFDIDKGRIDRLRVPLRRHRE